MWFFQKYISDYIISLLITQPKSWAYTYPFTCIKYEQLYLELNQLITCRIIFPHAIIIMLPIWQPSIYSFKCILTHRVLYCSKSSIIHCRDLHLITVNGRRTVTSHNNHIWKWIVSLYPYMVNSWRHKPPTIRVQMFKLHKSFRWRNNNRLGMVTKSRGLGFSWIRGKHLICF